MTVRKVMTDDKGRNYVFGFIVEEASFNYDDNHYYQQEGTSFHCHVYASKDDAEKMAFDMNVVAVNDMLEDPHSWFSDGITSEISVPEDMGEYRAVLTRLFKILLPENAFPITAEQDEAVALDILNNARELSSPSNEEEYKFVMDCIRATRKAFVTPVQVEI